MRIARWARRTLTLAWATALLGCIGLAVVAHVSNALVIQGRSMEPAIPRGALVTLEQFEGTGVRAGDVVTARANNGVLVTHRVERVVDVGGRRFLELRGDANRSPDPALVPADAVIGRVDATVPTLGYLVALLSMPLGLLSVISLFGAAMLAIWALEDLERAQTMQSMVGSAR